MCEYTISITKEVESFYKRMAQEKDLPIEQVLADWLYIVAAFAVNHEGEWKG